MIIVNMTLSFADVIQTSALEWLKNDYMPLLRACPVVAATNLYRVETQQGADDCFALQIQFANSSNFMTFNSKYKQDFDGALFAKFTNNFGVFQTILTSI